MKVLIACEYSGIVRDAFIRHGHDAMSCDILPTESAGPHYEGDVLDILDRAWDMMIAHPPCTHLAVSGAKHFAQKRADGRQQAALDFVQQLLLANIPMIALENPIGIISTQIRKPDQIIQPWQFGDQAQKTTCLWLKNLPPLVPTDIVDKGEFYISPTGKRLPKWYSDNKSAKVRSKTFQGIADAMAKQWGDISIK
jgi:site-specific DNA-cytosine methylase